MQALIFTGIVQVVVLGLRELFILIGKKWSMGEWTDNVSFVTSIIFATVLGLSVSVLANSNWFYPLLQKLKVTKNTSYPSEWFSVLTENQRYVVLHLTGSRRIFGWPYEWPNHSDSGHFVLTNASWLSDENEMIPLSNVHQILIPSKDVEMIEFLK